MITTKVMAITAPEPVFVLDGMTYLPHYSRPCWVQPGAFVTTYNAMKKIDEHAEDVSKRLSASELFAMGAKVVMSSHFRLPLALGHDP